MLLNYNSQQSTLKTVLDGAVNTYEMQNNLLQNCEICSFFLNVKYCGMQL